MSIRLWCGLLGRDSFCPLHSKPRIIQAVSFWRAGCFPFIHRRFHPLGIPTFQCRPRFRLCLLSLTRPRFRLCLLPYANRNVSLKPRFYAMMDQKVSSGTKVVLGLIIPMELDFLIMYSLIFSPLLCCQLSHALKKMFKTFYTAFLCSLPEEISQHIICHIAWNCNSTVYIQLLKTCNDFIGIP